GRPIAFDDRWLRPAARRQRRAPAREPVARGVPALWTGQVVHGVVAEVQQVVGGRAGQHAGADARGDDVWRGERRGRADDQYRHVDANRNLALVDGLGYDDAVHALFEQ